jgi:hypothetical protein
MKSRAPSFARTLKLTLIISMAVALGFGQMPDLPAAGTDTSLLQSLPTFTDAFDAYIYGYPLLMFGITERLGVTVPTAGARLGAAPLNQFGKETVLPNSSFTAVVLPSTTTLYVSSFLNLQAEPVILHLPNFGNRFFIMQMLDAWTNVSMSSPGTRLGSQEGDYALVGPNFTGDLPSSIPAQNIIKFGTNSMWIIGRIYTSGTDEDVKTVVDTLYPSLTLTPLSSYGKDYTPPSNLPLDPSLETTTTPLRQVAGMDACAFFGTMAAMMKYNPPQLPQDQPVVDKLANLGITPGQPFDCTTLRNAQDITKLAAMQLSVAAARALLPSLNQTPGANTNYWTVSLNVGTYGTQYLLRAEVALNALGANNPIDAVYGYGTLDGTGQTLDGSHQYVIHFNPATSAQNAGEIPPVNPKAFWSVTIYNADGTLVANNTVNYNAIGVPQVQGHDACFNPDNSLDLYLQASAPSGGTAFCDWLPIPQSGPFIVFLRAYWPNASVLSGKWVPPPISRVN